ncbi:MAG: 5'-nucleotidase C-terminal domain-containing protein [Rikenellaceae bacterium]
MKRFASALLILAASIALIFTTPACSSKSTQSSFVILSTNDMHAQIEKFPSLISAINLCRDTAQVILVDAGDRWTGNAFVDMVDYYTPIYELMNYAAYDVAIYGNHEFDKGQAYVAVANRQAQWPIISANIISDTTSFPQPLPYHIVEIDNKKIAFVSVVGNYDANGHPAGKDECYEGIRFIDPHTAAAQYGSLAEQCDMLLLVSHSGLDRDIEFAESPLSQGYDQIISAHSHDEAIETINGKLVSQTGSRLKNIGATTVTISASGEVKLSHRNIPLSGYEPDAKAAEMVAGYHNNPMLNAPIGSAATPFNESSLRNLFAETIRNRTNSNIGLYHAGGVRIDTLKQGAVSTADILNAEPFGSLIATCMMTPSQIEELIIAKFNDTVNIGESHYVDITTTTPYTIVTDQSGDAVSVTFPTLDPKRTYKVAMGDYIFKTYRSLNYSEGEITDLLITESLEDVFKRSKEGVKPDNRELQNIVEQQMAK